MQKNSCNPLSKKNIAGFSLVELLIVFAILGFVIAGSFQAITQFKKAFDSGEQNTEVMREVTRFVEYLRKDLHNAVPPLDTVGASLRQAVKCGPDELSFPVFADDSGAVANVTYTVSGNSIQRKMPSEASQNLVSGTVASLSWTLNEDGTSQNSGFQAGRMWIHLDATFGKTDSTGKFTRNIQISTNLFPVRWNQAAQKAPRKN